MFKSKYIAIIDIGSYGVSVFIGDKNGDGLFNFRSKSFVTYGGFKNGEWLEPELINDVVTKAVNTALKGINCKLTAIYVGVPGEFTKVVTKTSTTNFDESHKITDSDIDALYERGDDFADTGYTTINYSPIYFTLDEHKKTLDPRGAIVKNISLMTSFVLCDDLFINKFNTLLSTYSKNIKFISSPWSEAVGLLSPDKRDQGVLLCDIGYITTDIMVVRGDGIVNMASFSIGGGHIAYDLSIGLQIGYDDALKLKSSLDLNIDTENEPVTAFKSSSGEIELDNNFMTLIVNERLKEIAEKIADSIKSFDYDCPQYMKLYLTGGGITDIRGAQNVIAETLDRAVEIIVSTVPAFGKPFLASTIGIMQVVAQCDKSKFSFVNKIFGN